VYQVLRDQSYTGLRNWQAAPLNVGALRKRLAAAVGLWEIPTMNAIKVDDKRRVRVPELTPGDYYMPEISREGPNGIAEMLTLRRLPPPKRRWTKKEALKAINNSPLRFAYSWDEIKQETR